MDAPIGPRSFRQSFEAFWSKFRTTFYFRLLILLLVSVLAVLLLQSPIFCLSIVLIPAMVLLIPLWFGEKSVKNHAVNGVLVLLLGTLLYAAILTPNFVSLPQQAQAYDLDPAGQPARASLSEGMVTPFQGSSETNFTFTVKVKSTDANASEFKVRLQVASGDGLTVVRTFYDMNSDPARPGDFATGQYFIYNTTLPPLVHGFNFEVFPNATAAPSAILVGTPGSAGPFNVGFGPHFLFFLYGGFFNFAFLIFGFFLILLLYWWTRRAREIRGGQEKKTDAGGRRAEGGGEFTCTNCGADVSEDARSCPKCGAVFESEAEGEAARAKA